MQNHNLAGVEQDDLDQEEMIRIRLEGGPDDLMRPLAALCDIVRSRRIKVPHRGGFEHFEAVVDEFEERFPILFQWTMRTKIAE